MSEDFQVALIPGSIAVFAVMLVLIEAYTIYKRKKKVR